MRLLEVIILFGIIGDFWRTAESRDFIGVFENDEELEKFLKNWPKKDRMRDYNCMELAYYTLNKPWQSKMWTEMKIPEEKNDMKDLFV